MAVLLVYLAIYQQLRAMRHSVSATVLPLNGIPLTLTFSSTFEYDFL